MNHYHYAMRLRPIGQILESLRIESFEVIPDHNGFIVRDKTPDRAQLTPRERAFLAELDRAGGAQDGASNIAKGLFEWRVTETDVERYEREGRDRRRAGGQVPDSHCASHILRVIGGLVDQKGGRIKRVTKDDQVVALDYELPGGRAVSEHYDRPALYDLWVRLYMRRTGRSHGDARLSA